MERNEIVNWLLEGDVSIQFQTHRDLLHSEPDVLSHLREKIATEGWGYEFLSRQHPDGNWGKAFYQPKWTSTHYTLLDLKNLSAPRTAGVAKSINVIAGTCKAGDGGVNGPVPVPKSDMCINGMFLNYACYFGIDEDRLKSVVDLIISQQMEDGGFNCRLNHSGAKHSSMHTTINTLEGINEYLSQGYTYRYEELGHIELEAREFLLMHKLFRSDRTGEIINPAWLNLAYPTRWKYDILRALEYFRKAGAPYDERMIEALNIVVQKRGKDGRWKLPAQHPGALHFEMEKAGTVSRWNTLRAMRVIDDFTNPQ
ncbi:MAG: hypothetical protein AAGU15_06500 [Anaerolineaceae bacterium]